MNFIKNQYISAFSTKNNICTITKKYLHNKSECKILEKNVENGSRLGLSKICYRNIWSWLNTIFNRVDESRIKEVGPDRACAEWLLRCGAGVKWVNSDHWLKDYNTLPISDYKLYKILEVDATDSAIMHIGFSHFKNCSHIRRIIFHKAFYLEDEALSQLKYLKASLKELQISSCGNVSSDGLEELKKLKNLENLQLYDLPLIEDKNSVLKSLEEGLPNCNISFPYAQASELNEKEK